MSFSSLPGYRHNAVWVRSALICTLIVSSFALPRVLQAGQWYDEPSVTLRLGYDDNVRFIESDKDSTFSQKLSARAGYGYRTEISDIKVGLRVDLDSFSEESDLNTDNQYLDLSGGYRRGLNLFRLNGLFVRDTSRTSELETTGRVGKSKRRYSGLINPTWVRPLNERTSLQLGYTFNKVTYQDSSSTGLFDYKYHGLQGSLFRDFDELTQLRATVTFTHYKVANDDSKADDLGIQLGVTRRISETLTASMALGARGTRSDARARSGRRETDTNYGALINASLEKKFESTTFSGRAVRELRPTGSGRLIDSKSVGLDVRHDLSERWVFSMDTALFRNETNNNSFADQEQRTYFTIQPKLRWRLTRWWNITGSYRYRYQKYDDRRNSADSNAVFVYATYNWPRESVARWSEL